MILEVCFNQIFLWWSRMSLENQLNFVALMMLMVSLLCWSSIRGGGGGKDGEQLRALPGPKGLPFFGYLLFLQRNFQMALKRLANKYGPVYRVFLGQKLVIVLSDHRIIKEAFRSEVFSGRPSTEFTRILGGYGIVNTEGALWKEQRRYVYDKLRNFGARNSYNRNILEKTIMREVNEMLDVVAEKNGQPYDMHNVLASSLSNVICSLLMDVRFDHRDPQFLRFLHLMDEGLRLFSVASPASYISCLRYVPGVNWAYNQLVKNRDEMFEFFHKMVEEHKTSRDPTKARDFIDEYLMEIDKQTNNNHEEDGKKRCYFSEKQLCQVIGDLFSTGLEPVKDTLQWAFHYMVTNPHVQQQVQDELDVVVSRDSLPSLSDMPFLPYTNATVMEVLRMANVLGIGTARRTTTETTLCGYKIPKNAHVVPLIWSVHMDPKLWKDPETFDPSRFIDKAGRVTKPDYFLPFSTGRRMCIGGVLARSEIFLFLSSILHRFTLKIQDNAAETSTSHFQVSAILRNSS